ncbi:hypothetical protein OJ998_28075 [Solirubrobacter taibaiensis]|nr:hypothetical protein [Solirubrobacter taibaiensis]
MAGRFALIAVPTPDEGVDALAALLADPQRGNFAVTRGDDVAAFLAARDPGDETLVFVDAPFEAPFGPSRSVLVITPRHDLELQAAPGRATLSGAPARAVTRALRAERVDRDQDGTITARELYNRLREGHEARLRSDLDAPFVVARLPRHEPPPPPRRRRRRPLTWRLVVQIVGTAALLVSLPLPWVFSASGLSYAFGSGTAWPNRIAPLAVVAFAVLAAAHLWRPRGAGWLMLAGAATVGALFGLAFRLGDVDVDAGFFVALGGTTCVLVAAYSAARAHSDIVVGMAGAFGLAHQAVNFNDTFVVVLVVAALAVGIWAIRGGHQLLPRGWWWR